MAANADNLGALLCDLIATGHEVAFYDAGRVGLIRDSVLGMRLQRRGPDGNRLLKVTRHQSVAMLDRSVLREDVLISLDLVAMRRELDTYERDEGHLSPPANTSTP